ncbi:hypothetical protein BDR03DRAFT_982893 [Suillus americanus]|nr:hypothetical protein BDR03DRAFT_982893 [Suillus americanus]
MLGMLFVELRMVKLHEGQAEQPQETHTYWSLPGPDGVRLLAHRKDKSVHFSDERAERGAQKAEFPQPLGIERSIQLIRKPARWTYLLQVFHKISPESVIWRRVSTQAENTNYAVELTNQKRMHFLAIQGTDIVDALKTLVLATNEAEYYDSWRFPYYRQIRRVHTVTGRCNRTKKQTWCTFHLIIQGSNHHHGSLVSIFQMRRH